MSSVNHASSVQGHSNVGAMPSQESDRFLQQSGGELTQADRQEGYELPEAFAERTAPAPAPAADPEKSTVLPASSQPYQSRPSGAIDSHGRTRLGEDKPRTSKRAGGARRRPRKQLKWWQKPKTLLFLGVLFVLIALGVGLGAGLGIKKGDSSDSSDTSADPSTPSDSTVVPVVSHTDAGITVSQSAATVQVATATADSGSSSATVAPAGARQKARWA
ncbi:hypothetical protein BCR35DRAFT_330712 [Leucosporidium creatinivorum]|uniref:Uncharacterized protein n=1 Tax=Leucosporidium creatinivorum TaxID=106004 RepID=A0A1Y2FTJ9_9BASI|nr:hypothetical protein BCR35DRAFT_330712 [Leucosporidium creatinivorum]